MNTEKLEKLKKSLDNKFIPDNMKDKIRAEIKKLEADIKTDETITATEVKEEVKEIEKKVEKALEVAEEKEEKAEAKKEEAEERAEAKAEEKKAKKSRTKTQKSEDKPKSAKKSVFSIAKEIRKDGETWEEAKDRARKMMKSETTETKKKTKTETQKLLAMVRRNKEYKKLTGSSDLPKDATRRALPRGKRVSANGNVYYENRANRVDVGGFKNAYLENGGSIEDERFKKFINSQVSYIISLKTISQKREPIQNLLDNMEDYRSGSEIVKRITTDNLKYALQQKTVSKMNEVLRISLNALEYADGGTIIGTPETPLARGLDIDYTGLVGETGGMSAGEMFAEGGSIENQYEGKTPKEVWSMWTLKQREHFLLDHFNHFIVSEFKGKSLIEISKLEYNNLPTRVRLELDYHVNKGQYAMGGSLGNHGLKQGDQIIKTMSGGVQKVKTKSGDIVYVNLANGYRGAEPPLPFAKGGYTNERRHVNKSQDYEVRYAKNKPNRTGYLGKRSFDDGGLIEEFNPKSFSLAEIDEKLRDNDIYIQWLAMGDFNTSADKRDLLWTNTSSSTKWNKVKDLRLTISDYGLLELSKGSENLYLNFVVYEKDGYDPMNIQIYTKDNHAGLKQFARQIVDKFEEGGFMTDPNFGDFQNGVYATGGVTKNYIGRNELNTITIKKGNQKLTYKVSDVYNGAYKLEEGGNLEKTAFYVSKRNVVKVQLKNGKDVKVANGYWIKKGAKPIHTSKYDDGGMTEKEFMQKEINSQKEIEKGKVFKKYRVNVYENGFPFVDPLMTDNLLEAINFAKKTIEEQRKYRASSKDLFAEISEFTPIEKRDNVRYAYNTIGSLSEEDLKSSKYEDGGQLEMKFLKGGKLESKIKKKVDEVNSLIEKAIDKDGDPIMVVDKSGTWEEPMQYKPIVYKNGRLYFEYYEPYSGKTQKEVVNKSNIEFDGYPMLLDIAKMYRSALKQKGVSYAGGGSTNKEIEINSEIEKIIEEIKSKGKYEKGKESVNAKGQKYRWDFYKLENPSSFLLKKIDSIQLKNYGQRTLSNSFDYRKLQLTNSKDITIDRPTYKGQSSKFITYRELVLLNEGGGKTTFKEKSTAIAKKFEGKKVEPKYQKEYGKTYDKAEAKEVGNKIAGSQKAKYDSKMSGGGSVINLDNKYVYITYEGQPLEGGETQRIVSHKYSDSKFDKKTLTLNFKDGSNLVLEKEISDFEKGKEIVVKSGKQYVAIQLLKDKAKTTKTSKGGSTKRGGAMQLAKQIRKEGESWASALKRANEQIRNQK